MTRIATFAVALGLAAATAGIASAEAANNIPAPASFGTQVEVKAGSVLSTKDLARRGLNANDLITVTKAPSAQPSLSVSSSGQR